MSAPTNTVTYGTFSFPFANTSCTSGVIYAEDGFTRVGRRYQFTISGIIGGVSQGDLAAKVALMQNVLKTPRLNLRVHWDGDGSNDLFFYTAATGALPGIAADIDWGPKPGDLNVIRVTGGRSAMYQWSCTVNTLDAQVKSDVLAATWQWNHTIDASGLTVRTVRGKVLVDSGVVLTGRGADYYRNVVSQAVPVLAYFKRESQDYTQSEDGRVLSFVVTDVEVLQSLPAPVTSGHASWMCRLHGFYEDSALTVDYMLSGWFESSAAHSKQEVITAIFQLALSKFDAIDQSSQPVIFTERVFREDVYGRNRIDFSISATQPGGGGTNAANGINPNVGLQTFGVVSSGSTGTSLAVNPYGGTDFLTSGAWAGAPVPYDADPPTGVGDGGGYQFANGGDPTFVPAPTGQGRGGNASTATDPLFRALSEGHIKAPFISFHEVISYEYDNNVVMLVPKLATADPVIQQTGVPTLTVVQAGYSRQAARTVTDIPLFGNPPCVAGPDFVCRSAYVSTPNVEPVADGIYNLYSCEWRYVFYKAKQPTDDDTQLLPDDPRRPGEAVVIPADKLPAVINAPTP